MQFVSNFPMRRSGFVSPETQRSGFVITRMGFLAMVVVVLLGAVGCSGTNSGGNATPTEILAKLQAAGIPCDQPESDSGAGMIGIRCGLQGDLGEYTVVVYSAFSATACEFQNELAEDYRDLELGDVAAGGNWYAYIDGDILTPGDIARALDGDVMDMSEAYMAIYRSQCG